MEVLRVPGRWLLVADLIETILLAPGFGLLLRQAFLAGLQERERILRRAGAQLRQQARLGLWSVTGDLACCCELLVHGSHPDFTGHSVTGLKSARSRSTVSGVDYDGVTVAGRERVHSCPGDLIADRSQRPRPVTMNIRAAPFAPRRANGP